MRAQHRRALRVPYSKHEPVGVGEVRGRTAGARVTVPALEVPGLAGQHADQTVGVRVLGKVDIEEDEAGRAGVLDLSRTHIAPNRGACDAEGSLGAACHRDLDTALARQEEARRAGRQIARVEAHIVGCDRDATHSTDLAGQTRRVREPPGHRNWRR